MDTNYKAVGNCVLLFLTLLGVWILLSGHFTPFLLVCGMLSSGLSVYIAYRMEMIAQNRIQFPLYTSLRMLTYTLWLIREIIYSSINVAQAIWQLSLIPSPVLGSVKATQKNEVGLTLFANSITLTPGTVSIIVEKNKILVHALEEEGFEALREGEMDRRVTGVTG